MSVVGQFEFEWSTSFGTAGALARLFAQQASGRKLFVLRTRAGEGARGPSKSGINTQS